METKKATEELKIGVIQAQSILPIRRIQTAEGWKRSQLRKRIPAKAKK